MKWKRALGRASLAALAVCCSASVGMATTLVRLSLEQMSQASTAIVRGHVVRQETYWNPGHTQVMTDTTIRVENVFKGQPHSTLVVEQLGGTIGNFHEYVPGTVPFHVEVSYILFLEPAGDDPARYLLVGMSQGAYRIYQDGITHEEHVIQPFGGIYYGAGGRSAALTTGTAPLSELQQHVSKAMQSPVLISKGTVIALRIEAARGTGAGRLAVLARTTIDAYPNSTSVVPAGSEVEGTATRLAGTWMIRWTRVSVRGAQVPFAAVSEAPAGEPLGGKLLHARVR